MKFILIILLFLLTSCAGPKGDQGAPGVAGPQGEIGPKGLDGTQITPVEFCGEAADYDGVFPEYGLCINGRLYAVYSTHGGFLTELPDGLYLSSAVGSRCTFRVNGCEVSR